MYNLSGINLSLPQQIKNNQKKVTLLVAGLAYYSTSEYFSKYVKPHIAFRA
jgi:hypothetical protein